MHAQHLAGLGLDRAALLAWVEGGTPLGDPARIPAPRTFVADWSIGTPDQVTERMRALLVKLESPAVTDLTATFSEPGIDVTPACLPDLYRGEPVWSARR